MQRNQRSPSENDALPALDLSRLLETIPAAAILVDREAGLLQHVHHVAGEERGGILYFPRPPKAEGGMIVIPIVDLDDAVRYTVQVPLPAK